MAALGSLGVPRRMESELERLAAVSDGSANLGALDGTDVIIVARNVAPHERRRFVTMQIYVFSRLPAYCSARGRILLANAPERLTEVLRPERLVKLTPLTETDPARIVDIIEQAQRDRYATTEEELGLGYCAIAIKLGTYDEIDYALSISMPSNEFNKDELVRKVLPLLLETTKRPN